MVDSSWLVAAFGGALLGLSAGGLLALTGKTAGVSGILGGVLRREAGEWTWKLAFLAGLFAGGLLMGQLLPASMAAEGVRPLAVLAAGGLLVGVGTCLAGGCTSGHGICGVGRGNVRSLVATTTFIAAGALTVAVARLLVGQP
jgi:uncharacterized membrane protein YedE/YeeE